MYEINDVEIIEGQNKIPKDERGWGSNHRQNSGRAVTVCVFMCKCNMFAFVCYALVTVAIF